MRLTHLILILALGPWGCQDSDFAGQSAKRQDSQDAIGEGSADSGGFDKDSDYDAHGNKLGDGGSNNEGGLDEGGDSGGSGPMRDSFIVGESSKKVDVVFFFDQSGSMRKFISEVSQRLSSFIQNFMQSKKNLDYRLLVVAGDYSMPVSNDKVGMTRIRIGNHNALTVAQQLFTGKASTGNIKLRKRSTKEIIVVSNDNAGISAQEFADWVRDNRKEVGKVRVNGFVGFKSTGPLGYLGDCYVDKKGTHYMNTAQIPSVAGLLQDICSPDWDGLMNNLGKKITDVPNNIFDLSEIPLKGDVEVILNGDVLDASDYEVDDNGTVEIKARLSHGDRVTFKYTAE